MLYTVVFCYLTALGMLDENSWQYVVPTGNGDEVKVMRQPATPAELLYIFWGY